jgi:hypothetical protein
MRYHSLTDSLTSTGERYGKVAAAGVVKWMSSPLVGAAYTHLEAAHRFAVAEAYGGSRRAA